MKVTIPSVDDSGLEASVAEHFGQSAYFTVVDTETDEVRAEPNRGEHHGGGATPAEIIANAGTDVVLCGGLGRRAVRLFQDSGIEVFMGAQGTVQNALDAYKAGTLQPATEAGACPGHG